MKLCKLHSAFWNGKRESPIVCTTCKATLRKDGKWIPPRKKS
jgi:hypothetical protein